MIADFYQMIKNKKKVKSEVNSNLNLHFTHYRTKMLFSLYINVKWNLLLYFKT